MCLGFAYMHVSASCACLVLKMARSPEPGVTDGGEPPCRCWNGPWSSGRGASPLNQFLSNPSCLQNPQFNAVVRLSSTSQSLWWGLNSTVEPQGVKEYPTIAFSLKEKFWEDMMISQ